MHMFGNYEGKTDRKGLAEGYGRMQWTTNFDTYEGEWRRGVQHGKGTMYYATYGTTYVGYFSLGKKHGFGSLVLPTGDVYNGNFVQDLQDG
jgi:1-phosphatidylinositol-4-phosphate 5-kinase